MFKFLTEFCFLCRGKYIYVYTCSISGNSIDVSSLRASNHWVGFSSFPLATT